MKFIVVIAVFVVGGIHAGSLFDRNHPYESRIAYLSNITASVLPRELFDEVISLMRAFRRELPVLRRSNPPIPPRRYKMIDKLVGFSIKGSKLAKYFPNKQFRNLKIKPTIYVPIIQIIARLKPQSKSFHIFSSV